MIVGGKDGLIVSGDWWFLRQQRVPLSEQQIWQNRLQWLNRERKRRLRKGESLQELRVYDEADADGGTSVSGVPWSTDISMAELTEKAAKLCFRLRVLQLLGTDRQLQKSQEQSRQGEDTRNSRQMSVRFDFPSEREWLIRLKPDLERWTPDLLYKVAIHHGVAEPAPSALEWGAVVTWLLLERCVVQGPLPADCVAYAACAAALARGNAPDTVLNSFAVAGTDEEFHWWQTAALQATRKICSAEQSILEQSQLSELQILTKLEQAQFFRRAADCSARVTAVLQQMGVLQ